MIKKTSLSDIAQKLGVSKTLVSLVLNGKGKEHRISDVVCKKVMEVAREMNYQPNQLAKSLRTGKTNTIGLIIADIANPFFGKLGREIEKEAARKGYRVMFCSSDESAEKSKLQIEMMLQGHVDGFIISPPMNSEEQIRDLSRSNKPFVLIDRFFPEIDSNYIIVDNQEAAYNATTHLIARGYKKIACITVNADLVNMKDRLIGYKKALLDSGIKLDKNLVKELQFSHESKDVFKAIKQLTGKNKDCIDAILFTTSKVGIMGIESLNVLGLNIPNDIAIVSFDDPDAYKICYSPVTTMAQPLTEIGKMAVQVLLAEIKNPGSSIKTQKITLKTNFVIRKSCGS
ncbi:MAG: LacI family DNA-binding transcriptional regulator [Prolixibacteraceae bacterium]|jgi:LacI family transcriptional regulator|nr:LacI family DNA-binding transcriptional regulator [Prolixibacteraceae bacterium]MBT6765219.1 LacI family DNA-binding transcriptional regulator [Prolixibacteraceae bacterium]MBT6999480.1 LacI family DNA-binding transcriptional regulator [Prolixibacteraceae bacterium]MBT7395870.1 LacI family DNA-binding transcriptional regulator [Prolixibacteraceae bacterium]